MFLEEKIINNFLIKNDQIWSEMVKMGNFNQLLSDLISVLFLMSFDTGPLRLETDLERWRVMSSSKVLRLLS